MSRLADLESALIKADASGNRDDAMVLAAEIRKIRQTESKPLSPSMQKAQDYKARRESDEEARISELSPEQQSLVADMSPIDAFRVGIGRGFATIGRGLGLVDPEDESTIKGMDALKAKNPIATGAGEIAGESAPFLPLGVLSSGLKTAGARALGTAAVGATEGGLISRGQGSSVDDQIQTAGITGAVAGAMELALPHVGRVGGRLVRKAFGREPTGALVDAAGNPSAELISAMDELGFSYEQVLDEARRIAPDSNIQQSARKALLESEGLTPTKAQITRDASDFQAQQEAVKASSRVRDAIEGQEKALTARFGEAVKSTGGQAGQSTNTLVDAIQSKTIKLDEEIGGLYKIARESAPGEKNVKFDVLGAKLRKLAPQNSASGGRIEAVFGTLKERGIIDDDFNVVGKVDVESAEEIRILMNGLYDPQNPVGNGVLRELKDALDDDVFKSAGRDVFNDARAAKRKFEQDITRSKINKFDSRKQNLVRDLVENKIDPDKMIDDVVRSKRWRDSDLQQLKDYAATSDEGGQAWLDLRADVLDDIFSRSFFGPEDAGGFQALSRDKLQKSLAKIGDKKLKVIFEPKELQFLKRMEAISKIREPVRGTQQGLGPTAQALGGLEKLIRDTPLFGAAYDMTVDASGRIALKNKAAKNPITINGSSARTALALGGGAATSAAASQE